MKYDNYGQVITTTQDLCDILYRNPGAEFNCFLVENPVDFNRSIKELHYNTPALQPYIPFDIKESIEQFDHRNQTNWHMPEQYKKLDISKVLLDLCRTPEELQRVGQELLLYSDRDLFPLLQYLKYLVDTLRANKIVWGVGRGSSVASYVLYLLGVHKINSIKYELEIDEFLK
jgi:DNA polymerase III alpha subunit